MSMETQSLVDLIEDEKASPEDFRHLKLPQTMRAVTVHKDEAEMFHGLPFWAKDPRRSLHVDEVELPELAPDEVLVAVMASAVNFNNVWSSVFEPSPGFNYLSDFAKLSKFNLKHQQDFHILGTDAAGVVLRVGEAVSKWRPGDRVTIFGAVMNSTSPEAHSDAMLDPYIRAWGFETNFGAFAQFSVVRQTQLLPKAEHLSWEEAASMPLVATTAYRMLVSSKGACMKQGDNVLIWGASGGLGSFAIQIVQNGGGLPIGVVSNEWKAEMVRKMGCEQVIVLERKPGEDYFLDERGKIKERKVLRLKAQIRKLTGGEDCDIVFEHTGRSTFAASVGVAKVGGKIVTCGATSGYEQVFDNRYLWQSLKSIIGSHGANYHEATQTIRLVCKGQLHPVLSEVFPLTQTSEAIYRMHRGMAVGKLGLLCLAPREGLGIRNREMRERIGEDRLNIFRWACRDNQALAREAEPEQVPAYQL